MPVVGLFVDSSPLSCVSRICEIRKLNRRSSVSPLFRGTKNQHRKNNSFVTAKLHLLCLTASPSAPYSGVLRPKFWAAVTDSIAAPSSSASECVPWAAGTAVLQKGLERHRGVGSWAACREESWRTSCVPT